MDRCVLLATCVALVLLAVPTAAPAALRGQPTLVAGGLDTPWEVVLMPDGRTLVTERPGRVRLLNAADQLGSTPAYTSPSADGVFKYLGMALHPNYATNRLVYLYSSYDPGTGPRSRVQRLVDEGSTLRLDATVFDGIPSDRNHDGGRIGFGPDGKLYVTTGDIHDPSTPQNLASLNGKILRLEAPGGAGDGGAPSDNPFVAHGGNARFVWSYGHRHPQGLDWDAAGQLYATEHGPSGESYAGGRGSRDEVNRIERGQNYGWPLIMGDERREGMRSPIAFSGNSTTWAPAGSVFGPDGRFYFSNLAGQHLREMALDCDTVTGQVEHFRNTGPRLRAAVVGRGFLWLSTDQGTSSRVLRVPIDATPSSGARTGSCQAGPPPAPVLPSGSVANPSPAGGAPAPAGTTPASIAARAALSRLLLRTHRAVRRRGASELLRRGRLRVAVGGLSRGRLSLRLDLPARPGAAPRLIAVRGAAVRGGGTVTLRLKATRSGARLLPRARRAGLTLRASFVPAGGEPVRARRSARLR